jgi:hypothetical protein
LLVPEVEADSTPRPDATNQDAPRRNGPGAPRTPEPPAAEKPATPPKPAKPAEGKGFDTGATPLMLDSWAEFNRRKWGVTPLRLRYPAEPSTGASLEALLYLNRAGKIYHPPRNPYLPVRFRSTPTDFAHRISSQWLDLSTELAAEMKRRDLENTVTLVPGVADIRPWTWAGFRGGVRYTYVLPLPLIGGLDSSIGSTIRKAEKAGYTVERTNDMDAVMSCILETEERNEFEHGLTADDLRLALSLMGEDHFRAFIGHDKNGEPASAAVNLHIAGGTTIGWIGGSRTAHLRSGIVFLLEQLMIKDAIEGGALAYDLAGANMRTIAASKAGWGSPVTPYYQLESYSVRRLARWARDWWHFRRPERKA